MEYTKEQIVDFTINILGKIGIPAAMIDDIGVPISSAIKNLAVVKQMMEIENAKKEIQNDPETNIVGGDGGAEDGQSDPE